MRDFGLLQTEDAKMISIVEKASQIALTPASLLISGETGVGKSLLAQFIVEKSRSEGAVHRLRRAQDCRSIELKDGETVIIENLDSWSQEDQTVLSDWIDQHRTGKKKMVRWIAMTQSNPEALVDQGVLRRDLYYRFSVFHFAIPSLRERKSDILALARFFVQVSSLMQNLGQKELSQAAEAKLMNHDWTANIAELENVIERAVHLSVGPVISEDAILVETSREKRLDIVGSTLSEMERKLILQTLTVTQQNKTKAAHILGISIRTLRNKLNEYREAGVL